MFKSEGAGPSPGKDGENAKLPVFSAKFEKCELFRIGGTGCCALSLSIAVPYPDAMKALPFARVLQPLAVPRSNVVAADAADSFSA